MACNRPPAHPIYVWLSRYDGLWLQRHPLRPKACIPVDWAARDRGLAALVRSATKGIRAHFPPIRVSRSRLITRIGARNFIKSLRSRLPRTFAAIRRAEESHRDFAIRRLEALHDARQLSTRTLSTALQRYPALKHHPLILANRG